MLDSSAPPPSCVVRAMRFADARDTLTTDLGDIDFLGEITGGGRYEDLLAQTVVLEVFGLECLCLGLEKLIEVKRAAGRPKDFEAIAQLEALLEERLRRDPQ